MNDCGRAVANIWYLCAVHIFMLDAFRERLLAVTLNYEITCRINGCIISVLECLTLSCKFVVAVFISYD